MTDSSTQIHSSLAPIAKAHGVCEKALANSFNMRAQLQANATGETLETTQAALLARMERGFKSLQNGQQPGHLARPGFTARFASRQAEQTLACQQR